MSKYSFDDIRKEVNELAKKINAPTRLFPNYAHPWDDRPYIWMDSLGMYYIKTDRGIEQERKKTEELDELLYWIFADVTFWMAWDYEMEHRNYEQDNRRIMFDKQEELLGILSDTWREKNMEEHKQILERNPFVDRVDPIAIYWDQLRKQGFSADEAAKLVSEKYPVKPSQE